MSCLIRSCTVIVIACLASSVSSHAQQGEPGLPLTLAIPDPLPTILSLAELELDWTDASSARPPAAARGTDRARFVSQSGSSAVFELAGVGTAGQLREIASELERANPGAKANFVLYETRQRGAGARLVLTSRVALIIDTAGGGPAGLLGAYASNNPTPVEGVVGGYTLLASDPLDAVRLAGELAGLPGVKTAYPLLRRVAAPR